MRFRKLRIAWSVFCGVVCVLMIVSWVRSYWWRDMVTARDPDLGSAYAASLHGKLRVSLFREHRHSPTDFSRWRANSAPAGEMLISLAQSPMPKRRCALGFELVNYWNPFAFAVPFWFLVPFCLVGSVLPWVRSRFTVRTLLIAITIISVLLGFAAYWTPR